jgi:prephenate dehydrogenase
MIAHTCSVQVPVTETLLEIDRPFQILGLNPMFGPSLDPSGRPIAAIVVKGGPFVEHLLSILEEADTEVVRVGAADHDQICSITQSATHAALLSFATTLLSSGISLDVISRLAPPPCVALMALIARIVSGAPEVYWDIQFANPDARRARGLLLEAIAKLSAIVDAGNAAEFERSLADVTAYFSSGLESLADVGQIMLSHLPPSMRDA